MVTVINDTEHLEIEAATDSRLLVSAGVFHDLTGWTLKPEGLCRDERCVPIYRRGDVIANDGSLDLEAAALIVGLTAVVDNDRGVAAITQSAATRAQQMATLQAADFTLPDTSGNPVSLHDFDQRKVLLLAWSSW
jgi:hypothetical protein